MLYSPWKSVLGITVSGSFLTLGLTYWENEFDLSSLAAVRLSRAAVTVSKIASHYRNKLYSSDLDKNSSEYEKLRSKVHTEAAEMLLDLCCANKGIYIKVGQHIATLNYLVPPEYIKVMKVLHANAPKSSLKSIFKVLKEDLKKEPSEIFEWFEKEPLGTASLAQVHKAKLRKDGSVVAVKVQHSLVLSNSKSDMKAMEILVAVMSTIFEEFRFKWLVEETKLNLPKELDFTHEAMNAEKVQEIFEDYKWLKIPKINWDLTTSRVLTMEFEEGAHVTNLEYINENEINRFTLSSRIGELYSKMIFKHGFVHSDPHPGNILIKKCDKGKFDVILLDHGLYASLSNEFRLNYSKFWMSILKRDLMGMKQYSENLGIEELYPLFVCMVTGRTWDVVTKGIDKNKYNDSEAEEFRQNVPNLLNKIGEVLQNVNREMLLILKTNDLLRGIEHTLQVHKRQPSFLVMTKCCLENIYEERLRQCQNSIKRIFIRFSKHWSIFKLNLYYLYLNCKSKLAVE